MHEDKFDNVEVVMVDLGAATEVTQGMPKHDAFELLMGQDFREKAA